MSVNQTKAAILALLQAQPHLSFPESKVYLRLAHLGDYQEALDVLFAEKRVERIHPSHLRLIPDRISNP